MEKPEGLEDLFLQAMSASPGNLKVDSLHIMTLLTHVIHLEAALKMAAQGSEAAMEYFMDMAKKADWQKPSAAR